MTMRSGRSFRKSVEMASEELASFLYNLACRFSVSCISFECLCLSGLSCVHFIPLKSGKLKDFIPLKSVELKCSPIRSVTFGGSRGIQVDSLVTITSGRSYRKSGEMASELASILFADIWCIISFLSFCI